MTFEAARQKSCERLFTSVRADNEQALKFYLLLGFCVVGRAEKQAKIADRYIDEILIERFLLVRTRRNDMQRVRLGKTKLMVSAVGFGGIPIQRLSEEDAVAVVRHCLDRGVNFIDTANGYTTSEERIGKAIEGRREGLIIATKSGARTGDGVREHLALSLERLGVEAIDLYQFHGVSSEENYEKTLEPGGPLEVAREAQAAGKVRHIGITSHSLDIALEATRSGRFETVMFPFNFVANEEAEKLIPVAEEHDVGFIAMKPMGGGMLENAPIAFKYLRRFPNVIPMVGIQRTEEIDEIVSIMEGPAEMSASEEAEMVRIKEELGTRFCRRCNYCQPCPQEIPISVVLTFESFVKRMPLERVLGGGIARAMEAAEDCVQCGECEEKCPYELPIREMIDEAVTFWRGLQ